MRERLLVRARARLDHVSADQDPTAVLEPEAIAEAAALLETVGDLAVDPEVAHVVGWLYWYRHIALNPGDNQHDLAAALGMFALMYQSRLDAIPDQIRVHLDENGRC